MDFRSLFPMKGYSLGIDTLGRTSVFSPNDGTDYDDPPSEASLSMGIGYVVGWGLGRGMGV